MNQHNTATLFRAMPTGFVCASLLMLLLCFSNAKAAPVGTGRMLHQLATSDDWILQAEALDYLAGHRVTDATETIRQLAANTGAGGWIRGRALRALVVIAPDAAAPLARAFINADEPERRAAAARAYATLGDDTVVDLLVKRLDDPSPVVRYSALAAYAQRRGQAAWPRVDAMTRSLDAAVYEPASRALAWIANEAALERLSALTENRPHLDNILRGINGVPKPQLIPVLLTLVPALGPDDRPLGATISALQQFSQEELITALDATLKQDNDTAVRTVATLITLLVPSPELGDRLRRALDGIHDIETIKAGLTALGSNRMEPGRHLPFFQAHLKNEDVAIRVLAIRCIAHCKAVNLFDQLQESVGDDEEPVVVAALSVLLRAPVVMAPEGQMVSYLEKPLTSRDEGIRELAYKVLGQAGSEADFAPALAMLGHLLRGNDDELRNATAEALGKIAPVDRIGQVVQTQGFLANWKVIGTFLNDEKHGGFNTRFAPEESIDFEATYPSSYVWLLEGQRLQENTERLDRDIAWADAVVDKTDGKLVMPAYLPPPGSYSVGYAVTDFRVATERAAFLSVDGDDAFRVWLNDELVTEQIAEYKHRSECVAADTAIKVKLKAGANRVFVKSANIDHQWWVRLRLTDETGKPLEVLR